MSILVSNPKDYTVYLKSFDGDSVAIHAKTIRAKVSRKFNWQVPSFMRVVDLGEDMRDSNQIVKGKMPIMARKPPRGHRQNDASPNNMRTAKQLREEILRKKALKAQAADIKKAATADKK